MRYVVLVFYLVLGPSLVEAQESGYQMIDGTRVFTQIDHASDTATFSNDCGSQTLTHAQLGAGAIPTQIIPCPRAPSNPSGPTCPDGQHLARSGRCVPYSAIDCGNGNYCQAGQKCTSSGRCVDALAVDCGHGHYCGYGQICTKDYKCFDRYDRRVCLPDKVCAAGYHCIDDGKKFCIPASSEYCGRGLTCAAGTVCDARNNRCHARASNDDKHAVLAYSTNGTFIGTAVGNKESTAEAGARSICEAQQANSASSEGERAETCDGLVEGTYTCVALARSHDHVYGKPDRFTTGTGSGGDEAAAADNAIFWCKEAHGESCVVIPESIVCSNKAR